MVAASEHSKMVDQKIETLRVAQATAWYPPHHMGGTEVYVAGLVRGLGTLGVDSVVVTPFASEQAEYFGTDNAVVRSYPVQSDPSDVEYRRVGPHANFDLFCKILETERLDIYHQHSWTRGLGRYHLKAARDAGLKTVLTIHAANFLCVRGTLIRFGEQPCHGRVTGHDCAACWAHERGAPRILAHMVATVPGRVGEVLLGTKSKIGRMSTLFATRHLVEQRQREILEAAEHADCVIAVCQWLYDALAINGVPLAKLRLVRQGVDMAEFSSGPIDPAAAERPEGLKILFLGRADPIKGVHVLVEAATRVDSSVPFVLDLHCLRTDAAEQHYFEALKGLANGDPRIRFRDPLPRTEIYPALSKSDVLAVPSMCLETGPLVALEAKAAGLQILGSRLGGIVELVQEGRDGRLLEAGRVADWTAAIEDLALAQVRGERPTRVPAHDRSMRDVSNEMNSLYRELLGHP
jgi:glycosyltransferase involved in cell wall biosynthesis